MLCDVSLLRYAWCCTIWLFNTAIENPLSLNGGMNGKIIYKWVIYTMAMLNNQRVYRMPILAGACSADLYLVDASSTTAGIIISAGGCA